MRYRLCVVTEAGTRPRRKMCYGQKDAGGIWHGITARHGSDTNGSATVMEPGSLGILRLSLATLQLCTSGVMFEPCYHADLDRSQGCGSIETIDRRHKITASAYTFSDYEY